MDYEHYSEVGTVIRLRAGHSSNRGLTHAVAARYFLFSNAYAPVLEPTQRRIQRTLCAL